MRPYRPRATQQWLAARAVAAVAADLVDAPDQPRHHAELERLGRQVPHLRELGPDAALALPLDEQYLVATGRNYFRDIPFDHLHRLQFDLETTGLHPERDRIFMISVRDPSGTVEILEQVDP